MVKIIMHKVDDGEEMPLGEPARLAEDPSAFTGAIGRIFMDCWVVGTELSIRHPEGMTEVFTLIDRP